MTKQADALGNAAADTFDGSGGLVTMTDWHGNSAFELVLLHQLTAATDHVRKRVNIKR